MLGIEGKNERARNYLRAAHFLGPDWIPCSVSILPATWRKHREHLEQILLDHPRLFPGFRQGKTNFDVVWDQRYRRGRFTDNWGCTWENIAEGLDSMMVGAPLNDWESFGGWHAPDPITEGDGWGVRPDWDRLREDCKLAKQEGRLAWGGASHGSMYMRLFYLRGFENFMVDIATDEPRLKSLIAAVLQYNLKVIEKSIECGIEMMSFGDDLGMQRALPMSPEKWRKYIGPCFERIFGLCTEHGVDVYLHTDGHILEIIPDLIRAGVTILNPQIGANGLDGLECAAKGKVCMNLDLNRQLFPFLDPAGIRKHVFEAVERLNLPAGGLMLSAECGPDVPLANIRAICDALQDVGGPA